MPESGGPRLSLPVSERDHAHGPADAAVTLVEYGDFECPYCRAAVPIVGELQQALGEQLRFVFRHFPLHALHPHAQNAAEAAEAAAAQGRFFGMHTALFEHQDALGDDDLVTYAADLGLDTDRFRRDLRTHAHAGRVQADIDSGLESGVRGTPTFYIQEVRYDGLLGVRQLLTAIEAAQPDVVSDAWEGLGQRTIPRVVRQQSPFRPPTD